ncbi:MAG TPA: hypothetical protein VLF60_05125 [Candidatus Saccharimonadales bacterium]|nr:hypothetical protein [Candidatus Saccharimonadales bacterium]
MNTTDKLSFTLDAESPRRTQNALRIARLDAVVTEHVSVALQQAPQLASERAILEAAVHNEIIGREAYLASGVVDKDYFQSVPSAAQTQLLQEAQDFIAQNGHISPDDKLQLLRERPWRIFPIGYRLNVANWEGTADLDGMVQDFVATQAARPNVRAFSREEGERELGRSGQFDKYVSVVRSRHVAWIGDEAATAPPQTKDDVSVAIRKRSAFLLNTEKAPDVAVAMGKYRLLEEALQQLFEDVNFRTIGKQAAGAALDIGRYSAVLTSDQNDGLMRSIERLQEYHTMTLERIDRHIERRSAALIPLATSYNLRQYQLAPQFQLSKAVASV